MRFGNKAKVSTAMCTFAQQKDLEGYKARSGRKFIH